MKNTWANIEKMVEDTDLETMIRKLSERGDIGLLSLYIGDKSFVSLIKEELGGAPYRYMSGRDPVETLKKAIASVLILPDRKEEDDLI